MKTLIISSAAIAAIAAAAPVVSNNSSSGSGTKSLPSVYYVNGQRVDSNGGPTAVKSLCTKDDDVYTCAQKTASQWALSATGNSGSGHMQVQEPCVVNGGGNLCTIDFDYHIGFTECHLSDPIVVDHQDLFDCNTDAGCKETFTFQTSNTQMIMDGMHLGVSVSAGVNVGFFSAQATVTGDWMQAWSNSTTYTSTVEREFDLAAGDVCAPTTIQYNVECTAGMVVDNGGLANITFQYYTNPKPTQFYLCEDNAIITIQGDDKYKAICQALTPSGLAMDVEAIGGGTVWAIEGCMAS